MDEKELKTKEHRLDRLLQPIKVGQNQIKTQGVSWLAKNLLNTINCEPLSWFSLTQMLSVWLSLMNGSKNQNKNQHKLEFLRKNYQMAHEKYQDNRNKTSQMILLRSHMLFRQSIREENWGGQKFFRLNGCEFMGGVTKRAICMMWG